MKHELKWMAIMLGMLISSFVVLPSQYINQAMAAEIDHELEARLVAIELRLKRTKLIIKKLKHDYLMAVESNQTMKDEGLPREDVDRIEREFKHKVEKMIVTAVSEIDAM